MTSEAFRNDPMFLRNQFKTDGVFDLPLIRRQPIDLADVRLIGYNNVKPEEKKETQSYVHFFLDDYKFEVLWNDPEPRLKKLSQYKGVLSPQFSTYYTMPAALQLYNTFRSRWCGAYFQSKGLTVIPTVSWGLPQSYWYCFDGIEKGSVVAVSTVGVRKQKDFFLPGYQEMLRRIEPKAILCYSTPFPEMEGNVIPVDYSLTNHLTPSEKSSEGFYIKKSIGYIVTAGVGFPGGSFPPGRGGGGRVYRHNPKHNARGGGWGNPNPIPNDEVGQEILNKAYYSPEKKQLYYIYEGIVIKFQPDGAGTWHPYQVGNTYEEVPQKVYDQMLKDGFISKKEYNKLIHNNWKPNKGAK